MYKHILISTDGSDVAQRGIDHGLSLAGALGARVTIITVTEDFPIYAGASTGWAPGPVEIADYEAGQKDSAERVLAKARVGADKAGIAVDTLHVADAQPAEAIVETAKTRQADLIVMASHGRRGLGRLLLGSQASEVLAHSTVPVLVVK